ncbi:MAG: hypothetical protein PHG66_04165 [Candidatus Colwellbacteria bacterium]|nr:hypothetical protein [Candidatus Colwellbacteria bacterium]
MEYELKPAVIKDGVKYKVIQITDVALHTARKTPTPLVGKKIQDALEKNKPDRIYSPIEKLAVSDDRTFTLNLLKTDPDLMRMVREEEAKGYKVLIALPKEGIPVVFGKDTVEFINSKNGKRILRGLAKEKEEK